MPLPLVIAAAGIAAKIAIDKGADKAVGKAVDKAAEAVAKAGVAKAVGLCRDKAKNGGHDRVADCLSTDSDVKRLQTMLTRQGDADLQAKLDGLLTLLKKGVAVHRLALAYQGSGNPDLGKTRKDANEYFREAKMKAIGAFHELRGHPDKQVICVKVELVTHIYFHHLSVERCQLEVEECVVRFSQEKFVQGSVQWKKTEVSDFAATLSKAIEIVTVLLGDESMDAIEAPALDDVIACTL